MRVPCPASDSENILSLLLSLARAAPATKIVWNLHAFLETRQMRPFAFLLFVVGNRITRPHATINATNSPSNLKGAVMWGRRYFFIYNFHHCLAPSRATELFQFSDPLLFPSCSSFSKTSLVHVRLSAMPGPNLSVTRMSRFTSAFPAWLPGFLSYCEFALDSVIEGSADIKKSNDFPPSPSRHRDTVESFSAGH